MVNCHIIMGSYDSRKSSIIRALTGAHHYGEYQISTASSIINVFVQISALQEAGYSAQEFINLAGKCPYVLVPLWVSTRNPNRNGLSFINAFVSTGWTIRDVVVLRRGVYHLPYMLPSNVPSPYYINIETNTDTRPSNEIAAQLRRRWRWL